MVIPVLPEFGKSFGVGLATLGLVQLVFGTTRFGFGAVGGLVVDRYGERFSTMAGLLIVAASSYAMGFSQTFPQLVAARGFGGAGSALFIAGLQNRILRIIEPEAMGRATGAFRASFLVGIGLGPFLGAVVGQFVGLAAVFHIYATGLLVATAIAYVVMAGERAVVEVEKKAPLDALRAARPFFGDVRYVAALLMTMAGWWTISGPTQVIGVIYAREELELSRVEIGVALTILAIGEVFVLWFAGRASDRLGRRAVALPSLALTALGTALLGQIDGMPFAFYPLFLVIGGAIAAGGTAAGGLLADAVAKKGSGTAVGVNQMAGDLGFLISPLLMGALAESSLGYEGAYLLASVPAALVFIYALRLPGRSKGPGAEAPVEPQPVG